MKNLNGNLNRLTQNIGHDTAKNRLADKLKNNACDIYTLRQLILNHTTIKMLLNKKVLKIGKICGQNFTIASMDMLMSDITDNKNPITKNVTIISVVNNVLNSIIKQYGFKNYLKTQYWKNLDPKKFTYNKRIYIGLDMLTYSWILNNYSYPDFTCKLSDRQKIKKYRY